MRIHWVDDWDWTHTVVHTAELDRKITREDFIDPDLTRAVIITAKSKGIFYSIGSNSKPDYIREGLIDGCGLKEEELSHIKIVQGTHGDKVTLLRACLSAHDIPAIKTSGPLFKRYAVVTAISEDDVTNMDKAVNEGALGVLVDFCPEQMRPKNASHLQLSLDVMHHPTEIHNLIKARAELLNYTSFVPSLWRE